jgi:hypothetical protein
MPMDDTTLDGQNSGAMNGISSVAGPLLGGVFTDKAVGLFSIGDALPTRRTELTSECD